MNRRQVWWLTVGIAIVLAAVYIGPAQRVWAKAAVDILNGESLYQFHDGSGSNPHTTRYVYLPAFAVGLSALMALPFLVSGILGGSVSGFISTAGLAFGSAVGGIGYLAAIYGMDDLLDDRLAILAAAAFPMTILMGAFRGADLLVAGLLLSGVAAAERERWALSGLLVSLAAFKFTALPAAGVLVGYAALRNRLRPALIGAFVGQLPSIAYFLLRPSDLWIVLRHRGALSTYAYEIGAFQTLLFPVRWAGLEAAYFEWGFALVVLAFVAVGVVVATQINLIAGVLVGYLPMSYLIPAEFRPVPFILGVLVMAWKREHEAIVTTLFAGGFLTVLVHHADTALLSSFWVSPLRVGQAYYLFVLGAFLYCCWEVATHA